MPPIVFIFIPSITSIAFSLITKNEGEGIKSHGGHSEESKVIREFGHEKKCLESVSFSSLQLL